MYDPYFAIEFRKYIVPLIYAIEELRSQNGYREFIHTKGGSTKVINWQIMLRAYYMPFYHAIYITNEAMKMFEFPYLSTTYNNKFIFL